MKTVANLFGAVIVFVVPFVALYIIQTFTI